uniref:fusion protein of two PKS domains n=1 Tax=Streptomyces virginiae TaxID=1961 RepID=UPI00077DEFF6|nr:Chain A, fusion protein of two PKS domains [Streptomyces virginiae]
GPGSYTGAGEPSQADLDALLSAVRDNRLSIEQAVTLLTPRRGGGSGGGSMDAKEILTRFKDGGLDRAAAQALLAGRTPAAAPRP